MQNIRKIYENYMKNTLKYYCKFKKTDQQQYSVYTQHEFKASCLSDKKLSS